MMRYGIPLLFVLLAGGCETPVSRQTAQWEKEWNQDHERQVSEYNRIWATRKASFANGLHPGMSFQEVVDVWGKPDDSSQSVVENTHIGTFIYRWYGPRNSERLPVESYHLVFVDGRLSEYHQL
jgi:hypothetical protein